VNHFLRYEKFIQPEAQDEGGLEAQGKRTHFRVLLFGVILTISLPIILLSLRPRGPVIETVTTDTRHQAPPAASVSAPFHPQLPEPDADVELAGDQILAASLRLRNHENAAALGMIASARAIAVRALDRQIEGDELAGKLTNLLLELDAAKREIEGGEFKAAEARLRSLSAHLDDSPS
jgi:hypothetical protein